MRSKMNHKAIWDILEGLIKDSMPFPGPMVVNKSVKTTFSRTAKTTTYAMDCYAKVKEPFVPFETMFLDKLKGVDISEIGKFYDFEVVFNRSFTVKFKRDISIIEH